MSGPYFESWERENLVKFCKEAYEKLQRQEEELQRLPFPTKPDDVGEAEALRLADALEARHAHFYGANSVPSCMTEAAAELRRLHGQEQLLAMIGTSPEREMAMRYRIAALEQALGMAVECLDGVARGDYDGNAAEILATARQTLGGKHD